MSEPADTKATKYVGWGIGLAMMPVVAWGACVTKVLDPNEMVGLLFWAASCVAALIGIGFGFAAFRRGKSIGLIAVLLGLVTPVATFFLGIDLVSFSRGRALRRRGKGQLPEAESNDHWRDLDLNTSELEACDAAAVGWRLNGATELASIAAFSSVSNQLLALGAPSLFIEHAHRDALDEIRHARVCYEIASAFASSPTTPNGAGPLPAAVWPLDRKTTPANVAEECLIESCVLEGASARAAAMLAQRAEAEAIRSVLASIAVDEARHAEHGWETLEWLWPQLNAAERQTLTDALVQMKARQFAGVVDGCELERYGLAGTATWQGAVYDAIDEAHERLERLDVPLAA